MGFNIGSLSVDKPAPPGRFIPTSYTPTLVAVVLRTHYDSELGDGGMPRGR